MCDLSRKNKTILYDCECFLNPTNCPVLNTNLTKQLENQITFTAGQSVLYTNEQNKKKKCYCC